MLGEIAITSDMQITLPLWQRVRGAQKLLMKVKEENGKSWLKAQHSENEDMASGPNTSWEIDGETVETVSDFIFLGSKITAAMKLKDTYSLEGKL